MRILVYSYAFAPAIGGMEKLQEVLAREFVRAGHGVEVITETPGDADLPFPVHRRPSFRRFVAVARRCDVILAAPLSLKRAGALLAARRPLVISQPDAMRGAPGWRAGLAGAKRLACRLLPNVVPSRYLAQFFPGATVIMNPYDAALFHWSGDGAARRDVLFAGRLVAWKGAAVLIAALAELAQRWPDCRLTIAGEGEQRAALEAQAARLGLAERVRFVGAVRGEALGELMRAHAVMVVPSVAPEPFGIVALEGLACGCRLVVSEIGGLPEAVGGQALLSPPGDPAALAVRIGEALAMPPPDRAEVEAHLARHAPERIAADYLVLLGRVARSAECLAAPGAVS